LNVEELKEILEDRGYKIKVIRVFKNGHFKVVGKTSNYRFISWEKYSLFDIQTPKDLLNFPKLKEAST
jgi:hypothetical protein